VVSSNSLQTVDLAAFYTTRGFIEELLERDSGHIVNVQSPAGIGAWQGALGYICGTQIIIY
jgi:NADP-dependent 3-hydroxy acid dehydrogenase YdfG